MTQPVAGITDFNDYSSVQILANGTGSSTTATNVDGWDFTARFDNPSGAAGSIQALPSGSFFSSEYIRSRSTGSSTFSSLLVKPNDGSRFTLNSVGIVIPGINNNSGHSGPITLQGYLNGVPVTGAVLTRTVDDSHANTFDVSAIAAFAGIDSFSVAGDGTFLLTIGVDTDNINASNFGFSPTLTLTNGTAAFVEADNTASTPIVVDTGLTLVDTSSATQASATVSITGGFHAGEDVLAFTNDNATTYGNITASYDSSTGVLTLASAGSTATTAQFQAALRAVTYTDTAITPNSAARTITFAANNGAYPSPPVTRDVSVTATDQTPIITLSSGIVAFASGDNTASIPVTIDSALTLTDLDNPTLPSATVSITGGLHAGEDVLAFTNDNVTTYGNIAAAYDANTGVLSLTSSGSTATTAQWQAALRAVTYTDTALTPNTATRTIRFSVDDGTVSNAVVSRDVSVTATDQTPIVATSIGTVAFVEADDAPASVVIDNALTLTDLDNPTLASATIAITGNFHAGEDLLAFTNDNATAYGNITASYDADTGVLSLASSGATATSAQWQAALRRVTYSDTAGVPNATPRTISFTVGDGAASSIAATRLVSVSATPQTPIVTPSLGFTTALLPATPVQIDTGITVTDRDNSGSSSATVAITGNFHAGEDLLGFTNTAAEGDITGRYDPATGIMTLTSAGGSATPEQWQAALRAVTYTNTSAAANTDARTISFGLTDSATTSIIATRTIAIGARSEAQISAETTNIYRFFDRATGTHLFTASVDEKNAITNPNSPDYQPGYVAESNGFGAISPAAADPDMIAVYRFFDTTTGTHFMTSSTAERDDIINPAAANYHANYTYEPEATFYEHGTQQFGDVAVYRLFDTVYGTHFYTSDPGEYPGITIPGTQAYRPNLVDEGIAFFAPATSQP